MLQETCHCWKYLWNTSFGMSARPVTFCCISSMDAKWLLLIPFLRLAKGQKSQRVRPGIYRGWRMGGIWFFTINCHTARERWQGTLSWCRIQQFHYFFVHFCWMVPLKHSELQYKKQNLLFVLQGPNHSTLHPSCWIKWLTSNSLLLFFGGGDMLMCNSDNWSFIWESQAKM